MLAHVDLRNLPLSQGGGAQLQHPGDLSAVFDRNGNYVTGNREDAGNAAVATRRWRTGRESGITVRSAFDVKPGVYLVRLVVRDAEGQLMTAQNGALEIP